MLSFTEMVILCMPLAAAVLAVMKDTFKQEKPGARKKITPFGVTALFLAAIGFALSFYSTHETKKEAKKKAVAEEEYRGYIKTALDKELPGAISQAIKESQNQLNDSVSHAVDKSKDGLEAAIDNATEKSSAEVQSAIQSSGNAVASNLAAEISKSQERIKATLEITESKINETINSAKTGISDVVKQSDDDIRTSVTGAVEDSRKNITGVISQAGEAQTRRIGEMAERAVGEQIMQIPLKIDQYQSGRLGGPLSDIIIKVGDVSKTAPFNVKVYQENGPILYNENIKPSKEKGEWRKILFRHPGTDKSYQLEVTVQTQTNLFGSGLDYVVIRAISLLSVARK